MKRGATGGAGRSLERYEAMRDFAHTAEPSGRSPRSESGRSFVVQKHDARRLHYDFRLEHDGVLLSWAVPKGPSLAPGEKRLAVQTEDHPIDYRDFEGTIPEGQYGGGPVIVWDRGTWEPIGDPDEGLAKGRLDFELEGEKLQGRFILVRTTMGKGTKKPTWLLMKRTDEHARTGPAADIVDAQPASVLTDRTIDDVRAGVPATARERRARSRSSPPERTATPIEERPAVLPPFGSVAPQLATFVKDVPRSGPWIYEIKYDGYRALAWLDDGAVRIASRRGLDWTSQYPEIARALSRVRARTAIFDGEVAYVRSDGRTDFQKLQVAIGSRAPKERARLVYFVFDLLFYDGADLRGEPLELRKDTLRTLLAGEAPPLVMSKHVEDGASFFREACKIGLEGVIGKRTDRPYTSGRTRDWIKVKCEQRQELVIVGYTPLKGSRGGIGALLLGVCDGGALRYAGKVGTGFSYATLKDLAARLGPLEIDAPRLTNPPRTRDVRWVAPKLVCEVRFTEWTADGILRQSSFEGLRLDKSPREVRRETPQPTPRSIAPSPAEPAVHARAPIAPLARRDAGPRVGGIVVSHADRIIDSTSGLTKLDLVRFTDSVADAMLPFAAKRPLMLVRCPAGTQATVFRQSDRRTGKSPRCFVQKHEGKGLEEVGLGTTILGDEPAVYVTTTRQLVLLAQNNAFELHGWGSTLPRWDRPDWIVFDLDPDEALSFERVIESAFEMRQALRTLHLESWVKTTGGKGLHVVVPIARRYDWATVRSASREIARLMARAAPDRYVATVSKGARAGKVFIDWMRNAEGATAVLPYSARARPGLPVAVPIAWKDLRSVVPEALTIATVPRMLERRRTDPWADVLSSKQTLPRELLDAIAK